jgi:4-hydroxy-4-methyl-2-oxoglutarate aldolase
MIRTPKTLPPPLEAIRAFDTCAVANAIEGFQVRLRNEGFADASVRSFFPHLPVIGYAVTARIRTAQPPATGRLYYERLDFWKALAAQPAPRVLVAQDIDGSPGIGAFVGEVHAAFCQALDCVGYVTNGAVRDLSAVEARGFPLFAGSVALSHAYAHVVDFGRPIEIGGLQIEPGDLLYGDRHGILSIPAEIADRIPAAARSLQERESELIAACRSGDFNLDRLAAILEQPSR